MTRCAAEAQALEFNKKSPKGVEHWAVPVEGTEWTVKTYDGRRKK